MQKGVDLKSIRVPSGHIQDLNGSFGRIWVNEVRHCLFGKPMADLFKIPDATALPSKPKPFSALRDRGRVVPAQMREETERKNYTHWL